jgi:quinol monooxygenase YgiN
MMPKTLTVTWIAKPGAEDEVAALLAELVSATNTEPGCLYFRAHRNPDDPRHFLLYEHYRDEDAFASHTSTEHFLRIVRGRSPDLLESSNAEMWETV